MLKAVKKVDILYDGKPISLKKGDTLDVGKVYGYIGKVARGVEIFLKNKYGLVEVEEETKNPEVKGNE